MAIERSSGQAQSSLADRLRGYTPARVGLARTGQAVRTGEQLRFQLDHARARDAVHAEADLAGIAAKLKERGLRPLLVESAVGWGPAARATYLRRPDLGRRLGEGSREQLGRLAAEEGCGAGLALVIADGLSGLAVDRHALPLIDALRSPDARPNLLMETVCLVRNGRVAVGDQVGELLGASMVVVLIGERPGLSAPDSLGVYLTSAPRVGRTDAERNCISNIRLEGLGYTEAARRILFFVEAAGAAGGTGFLLKEGASPKLPAIV